MEECTTRIRALSSTFLVLGFVYTSRVLKTRVLFASFGFILFACVAALHLSLLLSQLSITCQVYIDNTYDSKASLVEYTAESFGPNTATSVMISTVPTAEMTTASTADMTTASTAGTTTTLTADTTTTSTADATTASTASMTTASTAGPTTTSTTSGAAKLTKTGVTHAAARVTRAKLVKLIPKANLTRTAKESLYVNSICALSNDTVLLACNDNGRLRSLSLHTGRLSARDPVSGIVGHVLNVAYEGRTDTLLLVVRLAFDNWHLVSLRRKNADEWLEVQRLPINNSITPLPQLAICGSRVLLGGGNSHPNYYKTLYMFDVSAEHNVSAAGTVAVEDRVFTMFACTRLGNDTLFALTYPDKGHVSLMRLESQRLEHLAFSEYINNPYDVLFFEELLLVADNDQNGKNTIKLLQVSGGSLTDLRVLGGIRDKSTLRAWTLSNDRLLFLDNHSAAKMALIVYSFE